MLYVLITGSWLIIIHTAATGNELSEICGTIQYDQGQVLSLLPESSEINLIDVICSGPDESLGGRGVHVASGY